MSDKVKGGLSILYLSVTFYMMITTKYSHALGDYVLEFLGLRSWTGDYSGTHLTVIYFGVLFFIGIFLVEKYAIDAVKIRRRNVIIIFVILMIVFSSITGVTARNIKKNSSELLAIGYNCKDSSINYKSVDYKFVEFIAKFELSNYSNKAKAFYISIVSPFYRGNSPEEITFFTFDGKRAVFELASKETKYFTLSLDNYDIIGGNKNNNGSGSGIIKEIILTNDKGQRVRLDNKNFFGIELNR